jgi:hypothetical protein
MNINYFYHNFLMAIKYLSKTYLDQYLNKSKFAIGASFVTWALTWYSCSPSKPSKYEPVKPFPKELVVKKLKDHEYRTAGITMNDSERYIFEEQKEGLFKSLNEIEEEQDTKNKVEQMTKRHSLEQELEMK